MAKILELPALGQTMEEGTITQWFKTEGDAVQKGEVLYEVMTDKVNIDVEAPEAGILRKILALADTIVPINGPVGILGTADEDISGLLGGDKLPVGAGLAPALSLASALSLAPAVLSSPLPASDAHVFASPRARRYADEYSVDIALLTGRGTGVDGRIVEADVLAFYEEQQAAKKAAPRVSPLAQRVASEYGVDADSVSGTGHGGKVMSCDIPRPASPAPLAKEAKEEISTVMTLRGMRKMVADAVAKSAATAPHVTLTLAVDMSEATRFRQQILPTIEKSHSVRISFTDIIAKATARTLLDHPALNSTLSGYDITQYKAVHLGIAVSLGTEGLIVPVVKNADALSLGAFSVALKALVVKAKGNSLASEEVTGGTFSITNLGTFGITQFNPIINPPQAAILGVCAIADTIVAVNGQPVVRPMMNLCLSFDHRVTDGAPAAAFLAQLKETLEQPYLMFA